MDYAPGERAGLQHRAAVSRAQDAAAAGRESLEWIETHTVTADHRRV